MTTTTAGAVTGRKARPRDVATDADFITSLESVRGIAALAVVLVHACAGLAGDNWALLQKTVWRVETSDELVRRLILALFNGNAAVSVFFVLSGFVLALSLRRDRREPAARSGVFVARRFLRIYPALAVNLVLTFILAWVLSALFPLLVPAPTPAQLGANLVLIDFPINGPTWTMLVEFLAVPMLLACHVIAIRFGLRGLLLMALLCLAGVFLGDRVAGRLLPNNGPFWTVVYAYVIDYQLMFVLGMLVAEWRARLRVSAALAAAGLIAATSALLSARALFGFSERASILIEAMASCAIIAILAGGPRGAAHTMLEWRPIRFLGRISYSLYLYHVIALTLAGPLLVWAATSAWTDAHPYAAAAILSVAAVAITVPLAWASYVLVERPSIGLGRRI